MDKTFFRISEIAKKILRSSKFDILGWDEQNQLRLSYQYRNGLLHIHHNLSVSEVFALFDIGAIRSDDEWWQHKQFRRIESFYQNSSKNNRVPALGLDTNLLISGLFINRIKNLLDQKIALSIPLILLSWASAHELHYIASSSYQHNKSIKRDFFNFLNRLDRSQKDCILTVLNSYPNPISWNAASSLLDLRGRKGLLGSYRYLAHSSLPNTLVVKSIHPYYTSYFDQSGNKIKGINSIFDSLIATEFVNFTVSTNSNVMILTMDKPLASLLKDAGVQVLYIERSVDTKSNFTEIKLSNRQLFKFLEELLVFSPFIEITTYDNSHGSVLSRYVLTMAWLGQTSDERTYGIIKCLVENNAQQECIYIQRD